MGSLTSVKALLSIDKTDLDFSNVNWQNEIALIGSIYEKARALNDFYSTKSAEKSDNVASAHVKNLSCN